jgi:hypothetical protein
MDAGLIVVLAIVAAIAMRLFWRQIIEVTAFAILVMVFIGFLTLVTDSQVLLR